MRTITVCLLIVLSVLPSFADVVFEEVVTSTGTSPTGSPENRTRIFISGDRYRAQRKMNAAVGDYRQTMQMSTRMAGTQMGIMNSIDQAGRPNYPNHLLTFDEWLEYPENKALVEQAGSIGGGGRLANFMAQLRGRNLSAERRDAALKIVAKYSSEIDAGVIMAARRDMADRVAAGTATASEAMLVALCLDYDQFVRLRVIRDACAAFDPSSAAGGSRQAAGAGANWVWGPTDFDDIRTISDGSSPLLAQAMSAYKLDPQLSASYQSQRQAAEEAPHMMDTMMARMGDFVSENLSDMMMNVLILRLDRQKVYDIFPPQKRQGETAPRPEDVTYTVKELSALKSEYARNQGRIDDARRQAAAQMAAYEAQYSNVRAELVGNETMQGFNCEHWKIVTPMGSQELWVTADFPNMSEIRAFDAMLKERAGFDRTGLALAGAGGLGDMSMASSAGTPAKIQSEIDRIEARGFLIKSVTTMRGGAPTQEAMLQNYQTAGAASGDVAGRYAAEARAAQAAGTMPQPGTPEFNAWMARMGQGIGSSVQGSVQSGVASGAYNTNTQSEMKTIREIIFLRTDPIPAAAFDVPAGATPKSGR